MSIGMDGYDAYEKKSFKHEFKVISKEEVLANRSNAYQFIDFDNQETALEEVILQILTENSVGEEDMILSGTFPKVVNCMNEMAKWQQEQDLSMVQGYLSANLQNIELLKRSYSEEEVYHILCEHTAELFKGSKMTLTEWFDKVKKK